MVNDSKILTGPTAQLAPALLLHLDPMLVGGGLDPLPGLVALVVADVLDLVETGDGVANVAGVFQGLLALLWKGELFAAEIIAVGLVEFGYC
jgi:uncharacterized protein (DUF4213/DUF364 family)